MLITKLASPKLTREKLPLTQELKHAIASHRRTIRNILDNKDHRFLMIIGPCSFHDPQACLEYATKLKTLADEVADRIVIVMRVYVEKPRSCLGWKGYINDPMLDESYRMQEGILAVRKAMLNINQLGLPIASEILNPITYLYYHDLLSWGAIGARTTESQPHREIASHLNLPIGFKNTTSGDIYAAVRGIASSASQQTFLGVDNQGDISLIHTKGNPYTHLILRGGENGTNYSKLHVAKAEKLLESLHLPKNILVDCAHGNSGKDHLKQEKVLKNVINQKITGNQSIVGAILESFLEEGKQSIPSSIDQLQYGCSITDACIGWKDTQRIIKAAYKQLVAIDPIRKKARQTRTKPFKSDLRSPTLY